MSVSDAAKLVEAYRTGNTSERLRLFGQLRAVAVAARTAPVLAMARDVGVAIDARVDALRLLRDCPDATAGVAELLGDAELRVRAAAIEALAELDASALTRRVPSLLTDEAPMVRSAALKESRGHPDRERFIHAALGDRASAVRRVAADMTCLLPSSGWAEELVQALERLPEHGTLMKLEDTLEEQALLAALGAHWDDTATPPAAHRIAKRLIAIAVDEEAYDPSGDHIRTGYDAVVLLGRVGVPTADIRALETALKNEQRKIWREHFALALTRSRP